MADGCYCDYEPADFYRRRIVTARKEHRCYECSGKIQPGEKYEYVAARWPDYGGGVEQFHTCERCVDLRQWVQNNVPCLCWTHGGGDDDLKEAVEEAWFRAPDETVGLRFGLLRRVTARNKLNVERRQATTDIPEKVEA